MKKTVLLFSSLLIIACSAAPKIEQPTQKSDLSRFDQVQLGLPATELVKLLGEPSRTYTSGSDQQANYWLYTRMTELGPLPFITVKLNGQSKVSAKGLEIADQNLTLAALESRYGVKDLELIKTVVDCNKTGDPLKEKLGADVYRSKDLGAEISVSFKGDIQRFVQNDEIKRAPAGVNTRPVCRVKR